jgi:hypothetical protein
MTKPSPISEGWQTLQPRLLREPLGSQRELDRQGVTRHLKELIG